MEFSTTIVAATVIEIINTASNTTRTTTVYNELPDGLTVPSTNAAETHIEQIVYTRSGEELTTEL